MYTTKRPADLPRTSTAEKTGGAFFELFMVIALCLAAIAILAFATSHVHGAEMLEFSAGWCGPCQAMAPVVDDLKRQGYAIRKVDVDRELGLKTRYNINSIPCFILIDEHGREIERRAPEWGRPLPSADELRGIFQRHLVRRTVPVTVTTPIATTTRYQSAVVRVFADCETDIGIGSGTVVRWNGHVVVLTAGHVVRGAKRVMIGNCGKRYTDAHVLYTDPLWDVAVLEITPVDGIIPVELAPGPSSLTDPQSRMEVTGFGGQGFLAVTTTTFQQWASPSGHTDGVTDWAILSGNRQQGDSGGGVFDGSGRLAAVLWGSQGDQTVAVQVGRLRATLRAAMPEGATCKADCPCHAAPTRPVWDAANKTAKLFTQQQYRVEQRPPRLDPPGGVSVGVSVPSGFGKWKKQGSIDRQLEQGEVAIQQQVGALQEQIRGLEQTIKSQPPAQIDPAIRSQLEGLQQQLAALQAQQQAPAPVTLPPPPAEAEKPKLSPLDAKLDALDQKVDGFLHKLPQTGLVRLEEKAVESGQKQIESGHPLQGFFGASTAVALLTALAIALPILIVFVLYKLLHAHAAAVAAGLAKVPGIGPQAASGFTALDTFNSGLDAKLQAGLADLKSHVTQQVGQATAAANQAATQATTAAANSNQAVGAATTAAQAASVAANVATGSTTATTK